MASPPALHDVSCVVHLHSTYSDGTGTVPQIAAAGRRAGVDVVMLTDHDTLEAKRRGEERWYGSTLVLVGEEVSPRNQNHYLAFGIDEVIPRKGVSPAQICSLVEEAGGFGFAAHPFSRGSERYPQYARGFPWRDLECAELKGIELWSLVNDTGERLRGPWEALKFVVAPQRFVKHPPASNLEQWDRICRTRRVVAIGGLDAHQFGIRVRGRVPLRLMGYRRSFRLLRTHVLCERPLRGEVGHDREQVYSALRAGRCYLAMGTVGAPAGFAFWAEGVGETLLMGEEGRAGPWTLHVRLPRRARIRLIRDGQLVATADAGELSEVAEGPGVYRVEARRHAFGRERTWIVSNPIYLR